MNWMLIRASGIIAYALLSLSVLWGLALAGGLVKRPPKSLNFVHESLSMGALVATIAHIGFISVDRFVEFDWGEIAVPGRSDWRPIAVSLGIVATYGLVIVVISFYLKGLIGQKAWRWLHYSSFGIWAATVAHGLLAGTDRTEPWALGLYASSVSAVIVLVYMRYRRVGLRRDRAPKDSRDESIARLRKAIDQTAGSGRRQG